MKIWTFLGLASILAAHITAAPVSEPVRGVNLGGWLLVEEWYVPPKPVFRVQTLS